ncbi:MAG TPA: hypothetical protein VJ784_00775 [Pyrinomonadaceae bacterium]|nr:hypothetical protein [Pyrinomonadaceae bacterium]
MGTGVAEWTAYDIGPSSHYEMIPVNRSVALGEWPRATYRTQNHFIDGGIWGQLPGNTVRSQIGG